MLYRLSELSSGLATGLALPFLHLYSAEVFSTPRRFLRTLHQYKQQPNPRFQLAVSLHLIESVGELLATLLIRTVNIQVTLHRPYTYLKLRVHSAMKSCLAPQRIRNKSYIEHTRLLFFLKISLSQLLCKRAAPPPLNLETFSYYPTTAGGKFLPLSLLCCMLVRGAIKVPCWSPCWIHFHGPP